MASSQLTPISGKIFRISESNLVGGTYVVVKSMNAVNKTSSRSVTSVDTFDATNAFSEPGAREKTATVDGLFVPADPGQIAVRAFEAADTAFFVKFLPMGGDANAGENTLGFTWNVKAGSLRYGAQTTGPQTWGFDLVSQADEVITTGGYIV